MPYTNTPRKLSSGMGWFDSFRDDGLNTYYEGKRASVIFDIKLLVIVFFTLVIATALIILVIGSRGRERWTTLLRFVLSLHTGTIILVSLTGQGWQTGYVNSKCSYTANYHIDVQATVGVHIGLKNVNITLTGFTNVSGVSGSVNYNERFTYDKVTDMEGQYIGALKRGLPWPIISVLEYVTIDQGGLRWMRGLHESGHFAYILLWCAFIMWIVSNVLIGFVVSRGAVLWIGTGLIMLISHVVYHGLQPSIPLEIQFKDGLMQIHYGWCFWLHLLSAILTLATGITVFMFNYIYPIQTSLTFLIDATHLKEENPEDINIYSGHLEISTPYTQRRKSIIPSTYTNCAFSMDNQECKMGPRSQSIDLGQLSSQNKSRKANPVKTSIFEHIEETSELSDDDGGIFIKCDSKDSVKDNLKSTPLDSSSNDLPKTHSNVQKHHLEEETTCEVTNELTDNSKLKITTQSNEDQGDIENKESKDHRSSTVITISSL